MTIELLYAAWDLERVIAELEAITVRTSIGDVGGVGVAADAARLLRDLAKERDALREELAILKDRNDLASDLLRRVVIYGGGQSWDDEQMRDWACDYRDWSTGLGARWCAKGHEQCGHRKARTP